LDERQGQRALIHLNDMWHIDAGVSGRAAQCFQTLRFAEQMIRVATLVFLDEGHDALRCNRPSVQ